MARALQDQVTIRTYHPADAAALALIFHAAVHGVGAWDYTPAQLAVWSPQTVPADTFHTRVSDGRDVLVAVTSNDTPCAFIELCAEGYIDCFYCHPDVAGTGVGSALYERLESKARQNGMTKLTVDASEAAKRFFTRNGFVTLARQDFDRSGVCIHNYRMAKQLIPLKATNR